MYIKKLLSQLLVIFLFSGCVSKTSSDRPDENYNNPGVILMSDPSVYSQVIAISDVHGMFEPLVTLLRASKTIDKNNNWIAGRSLLMVLGDSIDKGPQSLEVLNLWIKLQSQSAAAGGGFIHVLGNHEAEFLANPTKAPKAAELIAEMHAQNVTLNDLTGLQSPRGIFIHSEPVAAIVGKWLFCHSGFYPDATWADFSAQAKKVVVAQDYGSDFLIGANSILEAKKWEANDSLVLFLLKRLGDLSLYGIVFGHQPAAFGITGRSAAKYSGHLIKIDNGMPPEAGSHPGSLLIFTNPSEMKNLSYPHIRIVLPDGTAQALLPE